MKNNEIGVIEQAQPERIFAEQERHRLVEAILALKGLLEASPGEVPSARQEPIIVTLQAGVVNITAPAVNMSGVKPPPDEGKSVRQSRMNLPAAESLVRQHLLRRPHDTAKTVAAAIGCSTGLVAKSGAWKANQHRLREAAKESRDPKAVRLDTRAVNEAGGNIRAQNHAAEEEKETLDAAIDRYYQGLLQRIGDYRRENPVASPAVVARALGCTVHDVNRWEAILTRLSVEQAQSAQEDDGGRYSDGGPRDVPPRKRCYKSV